MNGILGIRPINWLCAIAVVCGIANVTASADFDPASMRVVVSVRKFTSDDKRSYHHLFLYSGDGKLERQLTNVEGSHDINPAFSPDGKQLVFQRSSPGVKDGSVDGWYRIEDLEKPKAVKLAGDSAPPEWYRSGALPKAEAPQMQPDVSSETGLISKTYRSPDGRCALVLRDLPESSATDSEYLPMIGLREASTSETLNIASFPGYERLERVEFVNGSPFLIQPPLRAAFLFAHLNSTDKDREMVLDLNKKVLHRLSPNGCEVVPIPDRPAFFCLSYELYQPLGNGHTTVNCEFLDLWNAEFKRTRFAPPISDFGGAAVWIPGQPPMAIPIPYAPDK